MEGISPEEVLDAIFTTEIRSTLDALLLQFVFTYFYTITLFASSALFAFSAFKNPHIYAMPNKTSAIRAETFAELIHHKWRGGDWGQRGSNRQRPEPGGARTGTVP
jgi:hypothetical protein